MRVGPNALGVAMQECTSYARQGGTSLNAYQHACVALPNGENTTLAPNQYQCDAGGNEGALFLNRAAQLNAKTSLETACAALPGGAITGYGETVPTSDI